MATIHAAKMLFREIVTDDLKCCTDGNETVCVSTK